MVRLKLAALRGLAAMTKEAELKEEGIDKLDRDSLEAVSIRSRLQKQFDFLTVHCRVIYLLSFLSARLIYTFYSTDILQLYSYRC